MLRSIIYSLHNYPSSLCKVYSSLKTGDRGDWTTFEFWVGASGPRWLWLIAQPLATSPTPSNLASRHITATDLVIETWKKFLGNQLRLATR